MLAAQGEIVSLFRVVVVLAIINIYIYSSLRVNRDIMTYAK